MFSRIIEERIDEQRRVAETADAGQRAKSILSDPLVDTFFKRRCTETFTTMLTAPDSALPELRAQLVALMALLQELSQAVRDGEVAATRLVQQATAPKE